MTCPHIKSSSYCKICDTKPEKKKPKPILKVSVKRAKENKEYSHLRSMYLEMFPVCEVENCNNKSTQIHHKKGRIGSLLTDVEYFLCVCDVCHKYIELNPVLAKIQGYSETRL